jgi:hypothetical protein
MLKWGVIKQRVDVKDLATNAFIEEINAFGAGTIAAQAKAHTPGR